MASTLLSTSSYPSSDSAHHRVTASCSRQHCFLARIWVRCCCLFLAATAIMRPQLFQRPSRIRSRRIGIPARAAAPSLASSHTLILAQGLLRAVLCPRHTGAGRPSPVPRGAAVVTADAAAGRWKGRRSGAGARWPLCAI